MRKKIGKTLWIAERATDHESWCWHLGRATAKRTIFVHVSMGPPVWWKPSLHRKHYSGISEWGVGWLLIAIQVAVK